MFTCICDLQEDLWIILNIHALTTPLEILVSFFLAFLKKLCLHKLLFSTGISNKPLCDGCRLFFFFFLYATTGSVKKIQKFNCWLLYVTEMGSNQTYLTEKPTRKLSAPGNNISCFNNNYVFLVSQ